MFFSGAFLNVVDKDVGHEWNAVKTDREPYGLFCLQVVELRVYAANDGTIYIPD